MTIAEDHDATMEHLYTDRHKFKFGPEEGIRYHYCVYCEYCGHVAWHGNVGEPTRKEMQRVAKEPCPRAKPKVFP